jgi:hypothetical protein
LRAARALVAWRAVDLAARSGVSSATILRAEQRGRGEVPMIPANARAVQKALEDAGVEFLDDGSPGVRLREAAGAASR